MKWVACLMPGVFLVLMLPLEAQQAATTFTQTCAGCHTIGSGRLVGPDLKGVTQRKDRAWLVRFIQDPKAVIDSGDPYAQKLKTEANGVMMPTFGISAAQAQVLLDYIESRSQTPAGTATPAAPTPTPEAPFTAQDVATGRAIFLGEQRLANAGPACVSCHTVAGLGGLGGGRLGPDLTLVYERLGGRRGLTGWLTAPASPTMMPIFGKRPLQPQEIQPLVALFEAEAKTPGPQDASARLNFLLLGLGVAVVGLVAMDSIWKKRLRGVRRSLLRRGSGDANRGER